MQSQVSKQQPVSRNKQSVGGAAPRGSVGQRAKTESGALSRQEQSAQKSGHTSKGADKDANITPASFVYLSEDHTSQLRQAFDMFDSAGTGRIKAREVKVAFYALGYAVSSVELDQALRDCGVLSTNGASGEEPTMDFNDFYNILLYKMTEKGNRMEAVRAFTQIDQGDKGFISLEDLREIAESIHMELTDDELVEMMLFAQSTTAGVPGSTGNSGGGSGGMAAEFGAKESMAVSEDQFLKLLKRANVF